MDEPDHTRGRVYGADDNDPAPRPGHTYVELVAGPLDGMLLDVTSWPAHALNEGIAILTDLGRYGPGGRALYAPSPTARRRFDWRGDIP